jgi:hypothetical protein
VRSTRRPDSVRGFVALGGVSVGAIGTRVVAVSCVAASVAFGVVVVVRTELGREPAGRVVVLAIIRHC